MIRVTTFVHVQAAPTAARAHRAGDLMILAAFRDVEQYEAARRHPFVTSAIRPALTAYGQHVETVRYEQGPVFLQQPGLERGVQRTLLVHVHPSADPAEVRRWEHAIASMGRYIATIRNSSLSRVDEVTNPNGPPWTHVWEQEFEDLDGLTGPYMRHAHHWAWVDRWFDPQQPIHIVDTTLVHAMCDLERSILSLAG